MTDPTDWDDEQLGRLLSETFTNGLLYGQSGVAVPQIQISAELATHSLRIEVTDCGGDGDPVPQ